LSIFDGSPSAEDVVAFHKLYRPRAADPAEYDRRYGSPGVPNEAFANEIRSKIAKGPPGGFAHMVGVACFTERHDELLMWSHYADGHRGICLSFATDSLPFSRALQVKYSREVPRMRAVSVITQGVDEALVDALILTKAEQWSYEREWRLVVKGGSQPVGYARDCLRTVYLGAAISEVQRDEVRSILAESPTRVVAMERPTDLFVVRPLAP